jgi:uncharacterized delta-60 repeat protein
MTKPSIAPPDLYRKLQSTTGDNKMNRFEFRIKALMSIILFTLCIRQPAQATPGDLDFSFGGNGKRPIGFAGVNLKHANAVAIQGLKIVVVGDAPGFGSSDFSLARLNADGTIDTTFGIGGGVTTDFSNNSDDSANAIAFLTDGTGRIVVAGRSGTDFALAMYSSDGAPDATFGTGGKVTTDFGLADAASAVAIQSSGRIVAAGRTGGKFALAGYRSEAISNGRLDSSFGSNGKVVTDFGDTDGATAVALDANDGIVVVGRSGNDLLLARYSSEGVLDTTFGIAGTGKVTTDFGSTDAAFAVAIQANGRIVVAGRTGVVGSDFALARYLPNGSLDTTFGGPLAFNNTGKVTTSFGGTERADGVAVQADGMIVAIGTFTDKLGVSSFAVARYKTNGVLDTTFSGTGKLTTSFEVAAGCPADSAHAVAIQKNNGRIVVAGTIENACAESGPSAAVARYHAFECGGQNVTILGTDGPDVIFGTKFDDVILGLGGDDTIHGNGGNDTICGGDGNDTIFGDDGDDLLFGNNGSDILIGGNGMDVGVDVAGTAIFCEIGNNGGSGISGIWDEVKQQCHPSGESQALTCRLQGTIAVFNPKTESTAVSSLAGFYLSSDEIWDENDTFLQFADIPVLSGGEAKDVKFNVKLDEGQNASGQFVIAVLDFFNVVPEANEQNNVVVSPQVP